MALHLQNYIDGRWVDSVSGEAFDDNDPANGELIATATKSTTADVDRAVEAARKAYDGWRLYPAPKRGEILYRAGQILVERKDELAREMTREMGKVLAETRGDVQEGIDMTYYMAGEGRRQFGDVVPSELPNKWAMSMRHPVGVVAAITPWNFPLAIPTWKIMPALVLGNAIVFKPASYIPLLAVRLVQVLEEAGLPPGVLNLVLGSGADLGDHLVTHPGVDLISFTGSSDTGSHINEIAGKLLKRVSCELGGKNAIVVMDDANVDLAVEGILWSAFGTSGQRCTAASRVVANRGVAAELVDKLVGRAKKMRLGHGLEETTDVGPVVSKTQLEKVHSYIPIAEKEGATVAAGGKVPRTGALAKGFFHEPTILTDVKPNMRVAQEEIFGPVTSVIEATSVDEAIKVVNSTKYGLSCSIYTQDVNSAFKFMRDAECGIVYVNAGTIGAEIQLPFGGMKSTGNGHREAGRAAMDVYSEWKSIYVDFSGKLQRAQMDTADKTGTAQ
ncbi:MAG: aldehyde dehydrogenase family protein [Chloroflexota bacterium]|nr:aldehyde dehydrogenase family protein [Chloroflexota bacterium]MDE3193451.1 aldehyde dehydrogenase family protein [Chloroflexota bacterium]